MNENDSWLNDLQKQVDDAHHTLDRAESPPPGLWSSIRAQVQPQPIVDEKERQTMISSATLPRSLAAPTRSIPERPTGGFRHYANLVATIALVLAVAVGGWLAMSQMPGGDGEGKFAALQGTPEMAQSCNVEPLSVDEVMEIVRNPYRFMYDRAEPENHGQKYNYAPMADLDLAEALPMPNRWEAESTNRTEPSDEEFYEARAFIDQYAECAKDATHGQYWALIHPMWVQSSVLSAFPVFADEDQVRTMVEEIISDPIDRGENSLKAFYDVYGNVTVEANPDISEADRLLWSSPIDEPIIAMGVRVTDENGEVIMATGSTGFPNEIRDGSVTLRPVIVVQYSSLTGEWYVLPWLGQYT